MVYLNNAATSWPKPDTVTTAIAAALRQPPPSAYRSTENTVDTLDNMLRQQLGKLLNIRHTERIYFTSGATDSLNRLLTGLSLAGKPIFTTATEHNSVLRPLWNHPQLHQQTMVIPCNEYGEIHHSMVRDILIKYADGTGGWFIFNHCSNVTGNIQYAYGLCRLAHQYGLKVLVDVSQSAGCLPVNAEAWDCDALVFTGHKALLGPQGIGGFYLKPGIPLTPLLYGGTGRDSSRLSYDDGNYEYEVGTPNTPGKAGLLAAVNYILDIGVEHIEKKLKRLTHLLLSELKAIDGVILHSLDMTSGCKPKSFYWPQGPVVSFNIKGLTASDAGYILANSYNIILRSGQHCSPLIHHYLRTTDGGTLRASLSVMNTEEDVFELIDAVKQTVNKLTS